jgi:hypothetical protein
MAKGQKRGHREPKKPKQPKKTPLTAGVGGASSVDPVKAAFAKRFSGGKSDR